MPSNNLPLLSICCLGYNHADFLVDNLNSISKIHYPNIEVIIVDDGSQDSSVELLKEIAPSYNYDIKILDQANTGNIGKNFNNAIRLAKGELITFISLDDIFNHHTIKKEIELIINNPTLAFVASSKAVSINNDGLVDETKPDKLALVDIKNPTIDDLLELEYSKFGAFYIQGVIFNKSIIDHINGFDEDMTGDDIILRTKIFRYIKSNPIWKFNILEENNVFYRIHESNIHKNSSRQLKIVTEYLEKYWPEREIPDILITWALYMIKTNSHEIAIKTLKLNTKALELLKIKSVKTALRKSKFKYFRNFIFKKERNDFYNKVILFKLIKISYKRRLHTKKINKIHYLDYK